MEAVSRQRRRRTERRRTERRRTLQQEKEVRRGGAGKEKRSRETRHKESSSSESGEQRGGGGDGNGGPSTERPAGRPATQSEGQSVSRAAEQPATQPEGQPASRAAEQPTGADGPADEPAGQPEDRPAQHPAGGTERGAGSGGGGGPGGHQAGERIFNDKNQTRLSILFFNAQSIVRKIDELAYTVEDLKPDIVLVTESWCNDEVTNGLLTVPGYNLLPDLRVDRQDTAAGVGGGLLVYAKPNIDILPEQQRYDFTQHVNFKVLTAGEELHLSLVYRPPRTSPEAYDSMANFIRSTRGNRVLIGDFNLPNIDREGA
jgi:hypothetical protein